jgi:hypothetical protein
MTVDNITYAAPDDLDFHMLLLKASRGDVPVYGVVLETAAVALERAYESHRPEKLPGGDKIVGGIMQAWRQGQHTQPWLYVKSDKYIIADDYFWLAMVEMGQPETFAAQVIGEPLANGLLQKVGPLGAEFVQARFGKL